MDRPGVGTEKESYQGIPALSTHASASCTGTSKSRPRGPEVDPEQTEDQRLPRPPGVPQGWGDERSTRQAQEGDRQVPEGGHHLGPSPAADLGAVLIERDIPHPVEAILNGPVGADERQEVGRGGLGRREARDAVDGLAAVRPRRELLHLALETEDLPDMGERQVGVQGRARPQAPRLEPAVALLSGRGLRGEKRPTGGPRCPA